MAGLNCGDLNVHVQLENWVNKKRFSEFCAVRGFVFLLVFRPVFSRAGKKWPQQQELSLKVKVSIAILCAFLYLFCSVCVCVCVSVCVCLLSVFGVIYLKEIWSYPMHVVYLSVLPLFSDQGNYPPCFCFFCTEDSIQRCSVFESSENRSTATGRCHDRRFRNKGIC